LDLFNIKTVVEYRTNYDTSEAYFIIVDPVLCPYLVVAFT